MKHTAHPQSPMGHRLSPFAPSQGAPPIPSQSPHQMPVISPLAPLHPVSRDPMARPASPVSPVLVTAGVHPASPLSHQMQQSSQESPFSVVSSSSSFSVID